MLLSLVLVPVLSKSYAVPNAILHPIFPTEFYHPLGPSLRMKMLWGGVPGMLQPVAMIEQSSRCCSRPQLAL